MSGRVRNAARDVLAATVAFALVFAVGYLGGRAAVPSFRVAADGIPAAEETPGESKPEEVSIESLLADLASPEHPPAALAAFGAVEMRVVFDGVQSLATNALLLPTDDEPEAIDLHVRFTTGDTTLTVKADQVARGEARTDTMTIVLTSDGMTFNPRAGMCTLELRDFGFTTIQRPWGLASIPWYGGSLICADVPELRSDETVSFTMVFELGGH